MATTQNCIYKSVTLAAGEQFTLPPGAEIISATDINSFTSTCPKPTTLDTFVCGSLQWGIQPISGGGGTAPFSVGGINPPDTHCIGVKIGDVKYLFPSPISGDDITRIPNTINSLTSLSGIFDVYSTDVYDSTNNRIRYITFDLLNIDLSFRYE